jgi:hypothetical protein
MKNYWSSRSSKDGMKMIKDKLSSDEELIDNDKDEIVKI